MALLSLRGQPVLTADRQRATCLCTAPVTAKRGHSSMKLCRTQLSKGWHQGKHTAGMVVAAQYSSVDPLSVSDGVYRPGRTFHVHSRAGLDNFVQGAEHKGKLTVLMAKSSHCRPCKKFAATYHELAERFKDCILLEIVGDASSETKRMMVDMKVKVTPSFFLFRDGQMLVSMTGTGRGMLRNAILERLKPDEAGREWEDQIMVDSDSEDE